MMKYYTGIKRLSLLLPILFCFSESWGQRMVDYYYVEHSPVQFGELPYVYDKKQKAEERAQWNKEFEQQGADWLSGVSEPDGYGLVSELAPDAIFHTYRLKNGRIRQFCDYVPTSPDAIEFHYLGVIEEGDDTVRFVNDGDGMFVQTLITVSPLYRRIAENGRLLFVATYDTKSYFLYRIECESLKVERMAENFNISAIKATDSGFVVTESRVSNIEGFIHSTSTIPRKSTILRICRKACISLCLL